MAAQLHTAAARLVLDKIADEWTILILIVLRPQPVRFNGIMRRLEGITHKALVDALKPLERNGLVTLTVLPTQPIGGEYAITALGLSLRQPLKPYVNGQFPTALRSMRQPTLTKPERRRPLQFRSVRAEPVAPL